MRSSQHSTHSRLKTPRFRRRREEERTNKWDSFVE
jgi:hypothetical protein